MLNLIQKKLQDRMVSLSALQIYMWLLETERVLTKADALSLTNSAPFNHLFMAYRLVTLAHFREIFMLIFNTTVYIKMSPALLLKPWLLNSAQ